MTLVSDWNICRDQKINLLTRENAYVNILNELLPVLNRYAKSLFDKNQLHLRGIDFEDLTQDAIESIWQQIIETNRASLPALVHPNEILAYFKTTIARKYYRLSGKTSTKKEKSTTFSEAQNENDEDDFTYIPHRTYIDFWGFDLMRILTNFSRTNQFCAHLIYRKDIIHNGVTYDMLCDAYEDYRNISPEALAERKSACIKKLKKAIQKSLI